MKEHCINDKITYLYMCNLGMRRWHLDNILTVKTEYETNYILYNNNREGLVNSNDKMIRLSLEWTCAKDQRMLYGASGHCGSPGPKPMPEPSYVDVELNITFDSGCMVHVVLP